jgi:hypothetical protein
LRRWQKLTMLAVGLVLAAGTVTAVLYIRSVQSQYAAARDSANVVRDRFDADTGSQPALGDLPQIEQELADLEAELRELENKVDTPIIGDVARNTPFVSGRIRASEDLLALGIELTSIAREAAAIANEARVAFEANGLTGTEPAVGPTWLDVLREHRADIDALEVRYSAALAARQELDAGQLPQRAQSMLGSVDELLDRATQVRDDYFHLFPLLDAAFGAEQEARYFVLLQNGQEMRPSGGFASTYAILTVSNGRLAGFDIARIEDLDAAYLEQRGTSQPAPGPLAEYLKVEEWMPRDSNWPADFPVGAQTFLEMYAQAGWPELQGVAAVNESVIADVLEIIGPYEIEIDGVPQTVDANYFLDLIQSYREEARHKEVVALLGESLVEQVRDADFDTQKAIFNSLRDAADQREVQVYLIDPLMQAEVVKRDWDGALAPADGVPTLAMYVANLTGNKASDVIYAEAGLEISGPSATGTRQVTMHLTFEHQGDTSADASQLFNGYHRTWVSLYLPDGAQLVGIDGVQAEPDDITGDPRALGFNVGLLPGATQTFTVTFELPADTDQLYLRRQSGFNDVEYWVNAPGDGCTLADAFTLDHDMLIDFATCTLESIQLSRS